MATYNPPRPPGFLAQLAAVFLGTLLALTVAAIGVRWYVQWNVSQLEQKIDQQRKIK